MPRVQRLVLPVMAILVVCIASLFGGIGLSAFAAGSSLPGDVLYPVKTTIENAQVGLTTDPVTQAELHLQLAERRLLEIQSLIKQGRYDDLARASHQFVSNIIQMLNAVQDLAPDDPDQAFALTEEIFIVFQSYSAILANGFVPIAESSESIAQNDDDEDDDRDHERTATSPVITDRSPNGTLNGPIGQRNIQVNNRATLLTQRIRVDGRIHAKGESIVEVSNGSIVGSPGWWVLSAFLHLPFFGILFFLFVGTVERLGFYWKGRAPEQPGRLPAVYPTVCVQLPMFNEHAVARRVIEAVADMHWPADRFSIQVLDDSTDEETRRLVEQVSAEVRARGRACLVLHRSDRHGYKAGALEVGRQRTQAEFLVIFDADFVPPADFLLRTIPHFYQPDGQPDTGLALVQAQWGHLNHNESMLTLSKSLWVDDHHTLQMAWRSAALKFVNFTGTAGVWRASAIESAGGWRAASLVEDAELSFRILFAGYRTKFVKEIVVPAELPATYTAYKAQQKRWTQGWVQVQRLHLRTLLFGYRTSWLRRLQLFYLMCISWQWPLWAMWILLLPFAILTDLWLGALNPALGVAVYLLPSVIWLGLSATIASLETKHTYAEPLNLERFLGRFGRMFPLAVIGTGMLAHQSSAFAEGLFGSLHSEFERTPKAASVTRRDMPLNSPAAGRASVIRKIDRVKVPWLYVLSELFMVTYQLTWAAIFAISGLFWSAFVATLVAGCIIYLAFFYGDHAGKVCFVLDRDKLLSLAQSLWRHVCERNQIYAGVLGAVAYFLVLLNIAGQFAKFVLGPAFLPGLVSLFYVDVEHNIPTHFSVLLILCAAFLLAVIASLNHGQRKPHVSKWAILSFGFLFMAYDEAFQVHERLNIPVGALLGDGNLGVFYFAWVIPGIALVSVLGLYFLRFLLHLPAVTMLRFLMAATLYIGGAIGVELIGSSHAELHGYENWMYSMIATVEESLEMAGLIMFIWALLKYCADNLKEVRFRFGA